MSASLDISAAYDGRDATFRLMRAGKWGPLLLNLGYFPYPGMLAPLNWFCSLDKAQERLSERAIRLANIQQDNQVLDVACGRGYGSFLIAQRYPKTSVAAIDLLHENIIAARTLFAGTKNLKYEVGSALELPFEKRRFHRLLCVEAAFHFPDRSKFLSEARRVLRDAGRLVVIDFVWKSLADRQALDDEPIRYVRKTWQWEDFFTVDDYRAAAASAGLQLTSVQNWTSRVTQPLQRLFEISAWFGRRRWGRSFLVRGNPLLESLSDEDWSEIERSVSAHREVRLRSEYVAMIYEPSTP